jgi:hypothetical protein
MNAMNAKKTWLALIGAALCMGLFAGTLSAQEPAPSRATTEDPDDEESQAPEDTGRPIRFRANPYDNASPYYYSSPYRRGGYFEYAPMRSFGRDRYGFSYRDRQWTRSYGYVRFWSDGYMARARGNRRIGYRRQIGDNGDVMLLAPFLAPLGPLAAESR